MNEELAQLFKSIAPFNDKEIAEAALRFKEYSLKEGEYFCKAGHVSDKIGFVTSGLLRSFYTTKGKELTTFFAIPGSIAVALRSFLKNSPAIENIQASKDAILLVLHRKDLYQLYNENWKWQQVGRILIERYYVHLEERTFHLQSKSAYEKYNQFIEEYPAVIQEVPLYQIASFLGITAETLSRIRKKA